MIPARALCFPLQYLHNEKKLLHGDMKSCNVVVKGDFETVKICDVGVSLQLDENMKGDDSCVYTVFPRNIQIIDFSFSRIINYLKSFTFSKGEQ